MNRLHRPTFAQVDLSKVASNFKSLKSLLSPGAFICPMVKANAYGHGEVQVSRALRAAGASNLGVAFIEEGVRLRSAGDRGSLLIFGMFDDSDVAAILENDLTPVLSDWSQLNALEKRVAQSARSLPFRVHLKFNTGMNRLGFQVDQAGALRAWFDGHSAFTIEGICTHLLRGDDAGDLSGESQAQFVNFATALESFRGLSFHTHALNSSGTANLWKRVLDQKNLDRVFWPLGARPGLSTYGIQATNDERVKIPVSPVLEFKSRIVLTRKIEAGSAVSYNAIWRSKRESVIGVVPVGYADGYFRSFSNRGSVLVRGQKVPVTGTVCMDYFMVDLTDLVTGSESAVGEEVVLIGSQGHQEITAVDLASLIDTIPYEILTHISDRVPRVYISSGTT